MSQAAADAAFAKVKGTLDYADFGECVWRGMGGNSVPPAIALSTCNVCGCGWVDGGEHSTMQTLVSVCVGGGGWMGMG